MGMHEATAEAGQGDPGLRLWEIEHPHYCATSNYFNIDQHFAYGSWQEFHEACGDIDVGWNLVFRWDWNPNDSAIEGLAALREYAARFGEHDHAWTLQLFRMLQGNGIFQCTEIQVCKADEPAVRAWLALRADHMRTLWQPLIAPAAAAPEPTIMGDKVIATVAVVDVAAGLHPDYRSGLRQALYGGEPEHDYRFHVTVSRGEVTMHAGASADDVIAYLAQDRQHHGQDL